MRADKKFDMLIIPSQHYGYTGKYNDYFTKKKWNYFIAHLLGVKPIWVFPLRQNCVRRKEVSAKRTIICSSC